MYRPRFFIVLFINNLLKKFSSTISKILLSSKLHFLVKLRKVSIKTFFHQHDYLGRHGTVAILKEVFVTVTR